MRESASHGTRTCDAAQHVQPRSVREPAPPPFPRPWTVWSVAQSFQYLRSTVDARQIARPIVRVLAAHALQGTSCRPAIDAMQAIQSRAAEPQELGEACMPPKGIIQLHSRKLR